MTIRAVVCSATAQHSQLHKEDNVVVCSNNKSSWFFIIFTMTYTPSGKQWDMIESVRTIHQFSLSTRLFLNIDTPIFFFFFTQNSDDSCDRKDTRTHTHCRNNDIEDGEGCCYLPLPSHSTAPAVGTLWCRWLSWILTALSLLIYHSLVCVCVRERDDGCRTFQCSLTELCCLDCRSLWRSVFMSCTKHASVVVERWYMLQMHVCLLKVNPLTQLFYFYSFWALTWSVLRSCSFPLSAKMFSMWLRSSWQPRSVFLCLPGCSSAYGSHCDITDTHLNCPTPCFFIFIFFYLFIK